MENGKILKQSKEDNCKMFIGGLSWETDEARLKKYFEKYGRVKDVDIKRDFETNRSRGFGFVLFWCRLQFSLWLGAFFSKSLLKI